MKHKVLTLLVFLVFSSFSIAQEASVYSAYTISSNLKDHANAVVRYNDVAINIESFDKIVYTNTHVVTILNKAGNTKTGTTVYYDENINIKKLEARIFNASGAEIKKIKKKDFEDVSAVPGGTLYSDSRVKYLKYTPTTYPYTVHFITEVEYETTAYLSGWSPVEGFHISTEQSSYKVTNNSDVALKVLTKNLEAYEITTHGKYHYSVKNIKALQPEVYGPQFSTYTPMVKVALKSFVMNGVEGVNNNWNDFGAWIDNSLLNGTEELPDAIKKDIQNLTAGVTSNIDKARLVYKYMQDKTRYISVQVGIGGWKPMLAEDVDRLGYADCKGLSNYTKALLDAAGVTSYYAIIYGDRNIRNINKDFSGAEGNHAVLCIPDANGVYTWLECTSQTDPFGFIANWTDDRDALVITPQGGKIVHTTSYSEKESVQDTKAEVVLNGNGTINGNVTITTTGYQYALHEGIQNRPVREHDLYFKNHWDYINNLSVTDINFTNNKDVVVFTENATVNATSYAQKSGSRLLVIPNMFNRVTYTPTRYKNRTLDFEIQRGFTDVDTFIITLDDAYSVEAMPEPVNITNKFGSYSAAITIDAAGKLLYKRTYMLRKGFYPKEDYASYRAFIASIVKHDKAKMVLVAK
ncbi:DUF3857 domain-containing protein [Lacinutrix undariae]